jgi:hypothetical protein
MEAQGKEGLSEATMSYINDYSFKAMADQRQRDLMAEAAQNRLAAIARGSRPVWWRRLLGTWRHTAPRPADSAAISTSFLATKPVGRSRHTAVAR